MSAELQVKETLPELSFNFDELKAWAVGLTENYNGLVVTEDMVPAIKSEMAGLNKMRDKLETARKEAVKRVSAPIKDFEAQVKEVVGIFTTAREGLAEQVHAYEQRARDEKRASVQFAIDAAKDEHGVQGLAIPIQESWLNKTAKMQTVKAEVDAIILAHLKAEREREELARARQERAFAIEQKVQALNAAHSMTVAVSTFTRMTEGDTPLADVFEAIEKHFASRVEAAEVERRRAEERARLEAERQAEAERRAEEARSEAARRAEADRIAEEERKAKAAALVNPAPQPVAPTPAPAPEYRSLSIAINYDAAAEGQVVDLLRQLEAVCAGFVVHRHAA
jgi:hypothetical protein